MSWDWLPPMYRLSRRTSLIVGQPGASAVRSSVYTPPVGRASPWHHTYPGPVWNDTANEPLLDGDAKLNAARLLRSRGSESVTPNQPPSVPVSGSLCARSAWTAVVVASVPAVGLKSSGPQPCTPFSKSKSSSAAPGWGLTVTVKTAGFDTR